MTELHMIVDEKQDKVCMVMNVQTARIITSAMRVSYINSLERLEKEEKQILEEGYQRTHDMYADLYNSLPER